MFGNLGGFLRDYITPVVRAHTSPNNWKPRSDAQRIWQMNKALAVSIVKKLEDLETKMQTESLEPHCYSIDFQAVYTASGHLVPQCEIDALQFVAVEGKNYGKKIQSYISKCVTIPNLTRIHLCYQYGYLQTSVVCCGSQISTYHKVEADPEDVIYSVGAKYCEIVRDKAFWDNPEMQSTPLCDRTTKIFINRLRKHLKRLPLDYSVSWDVMTGDILTLPYGTQQYLDLEGDSSGSFTLRVYVRIGEDENKQEKHAMYLFKLNEVYE